MSAIEQQQRPPTEQEQQNFAFAKMISDNFHSIKGQNDRNITEAFSMMLQQCVERMTQKDNTIAELQRQIEELKNPKPAPTQ